MADLNNKALTWGRRALKLAGVLVVGALGSGLWSRIFEPFLSFFVRVAANLSHSYRDSVYANAASGFHEAASVTSLQILVMLFLLFMVLPALMPPRLTKALQKEAADYSEAQIRRWHRVITATRAGVGALCVAMALQSARFIWINRITTESLKAIEILGPVIDEHQRLTLRAEFFQVENWDDYAHFQNHVGDLAVQHHIALPYFKPL